MVIMTATAMHEFRSVRENDAQKDYLAYTRFRLRVYICSFISMMIVVSTAAALIIQIANFSTFRDKKYELAEGDMRVVSVSTAFCEGITLGNDSPARKLWILSSLRIAPILRHSNFSTEVFVSRLQYWFKGFYLLEGSSVTINSVADSSFKLFIFRGRDRLDEWLAQHREPHQENGLESDDQDIWPSTQISYMLSILETSNYYILFKHMRGMKDLSKLTVNLTLIRTVYDLDSSVYSCSAGTKEICSARLLFGSSEIGVIEVTGSNDSSYLSNGLVCTWSCEPRIWFYLAVFVGFIMLSLFVSLALYFIIINRKREKYSQLERLASQRLHAEACSSQPASVSLDRSNSFGNRSLSGSIRRPPSRTPSTRSVSNLSGVSRVPRLIPVVTSMYTGTFTSEDSGHDTDEENKGAKPKRRSRRTDSVERVSVTSRGNVSRTPSFSTFQGSEDEYREVKERKPRDRDMNPGLRDCVDGKRKSNDRARKSSLETLPAHPIICKNLPNGTVPNRLPIRRHSSEEMCDRVSRTLPRNRGNSSSDDFHSQFAPEFYLTSNRPASLPSLQLPEGELGNTDPSAVCRPLLSDCNGDIAHDGQKPVKLRTHSGRRKEMSWTPRLSMVSEV